MSEDSTVDGLKTGHTEDAGYCLVASAKRNGMRLVSVVLGTNSVQARKRDTRNLLSYGFRFFETGEVLEAGTQLTEARVWKGQKEEVALGVADSLSLTVPRGKLDEIDRQVVVERVLEAPIAVGDVLGSLQLQLDGKVLAEIPLVAVAEVEEAGFFARVWDQIKLWLALLFGSIEGGAPTATDPDQ